MDDADTIQTSEAPQDSSPNVQQKRMAPSAGSLKIQSGSNKPLSWERLSHAGRAMVERRRVTHRGRRIARNAHKKTGAGIQRRAQIASFNFPNNPATSDSSTACRERD